MQRIHSGTFCLVSLVYGDPSTLTLRQLVIRIFENVIYGCDAERSLGGSKLPAALAVIEAAWRRGAAAPTQTDF